MRGGRAECVSSVQPEGARLGGREPRRRPSLSRPAEGKEGPRAGTGPKPAGQCLLPAEAVAGAQP